MQRTNFDWMVCEEMWKAWKGFDEVMFTSAPFLEILKDIPGFFTVKLYLVITFGLPYNLPFQALELLKIFFVPYDGPASLSTKKDWNDRGDNALVLFKLECAPSRHLFASFD